MEDTLTFIPLLLVLVLAFIVPLLLTRFKRLYLPIVVGEILAGILIGPSILGWVQGDETILVLLAEFGFVFLMFLSGMEINFSNLGTVGNPEQAQKQEKFHWGPIQLGIGSFLLTLILSTFVGVAAFNRGIAQSPWIVALIFSTTSLGVILPVLKELGLSSGRYGQTLLISALIADFVTMLLITVLVAALSHGLTLDILLVSVLFAAFFLIYRVGNLFFNRLSFLRRAMEEVSSATGQIKIRLAFTLMLVFVVLSEIVGTEIILGAFLAGAIIALLRTPEDDELVSQLEGIGFGFFIPIFFIMVGVTFNLGALLSSPENLIIAVGLLIAAFLVKVLPALLYRFVFTWRESLAAGALLSARLSLIIATSAIGLRLGLIGEVLNSQIILVAIITVTISPIIFSRLIPAPSTDVERPIIVAGAGQLGLQVAEKLRIHHENVVIVDFDSDRVMRAKQRGFDARTGLADCPDDKLADCFDFAKALVCTHNNTDRNYRICHEARTVFGIDHIVAMVSKPADIPRFERLGIAAINAALEQASLLEVITRNPAMYDLLTSVEEDKVVVEVDVSSYRCYGKTLRQLSLPGDVLILALRRQGEVLVPNGDTRIEQGDHLSLVGSLECTEAARDMFTENL